MLIFWFIEFHMMEIKKYNHEIHDTDHKYTITKNGISTKKFLNTKSAKTYLF